MARRPRSIGAEYRLSFTPTTNSRTNSPSMLVALETAQSFAAFRYGLSVTETREGSHILYTVRGLAAPDLSLAGAGPAGFIREYDDLWGTCEFRVHGLDGTISSCAVRLTPGRAELITASDTPHLVVETADPATRGEEHA